MTDPGLADATYIEPITPEIVEKIIAREKPDALLPTMGGQTALNTAMTARRATARWTATACELIGAKSEVIDRAEDRLKFRDAMAEIGIESPRSAIAHSMEEAREALAMTGLPAVIRPSFTLGGTGGGIAYNREEFEQIVAGGLEASPTTEVLIEESVLGWKEFEMEVVRDRADNCIIVCSIENVDPMGIHTGDTVTVAPALTLTDKEYQRMRDASIACLRKIGVDTGGSNVQFAVNPADGRMVVIEMNPRVSRSSALASKATGFPDRQDRREARGGLHAGRTGQRHHPRHAGQLRAHHRLRRGEDPPLHLREIPRHAGDADHVDEVGRRGDGDRPQLRRSAAEGAAQHGNRPVRPGRDRTARRWRPRRVPRRAVRAAARPAADGRTGVARRPVGGRHPRRDEIRSRGSCANCPGSSMPNAASPPPACRAMPARCAA